MVPKTKKRPVEKITGNISDILKKDKLSDKDLAWVLKRETNVRYQKIYAMRNTIYKQISITAESIAKKIALNVSHKYTDRFIRSNLETLSNTLHKSVETSLNTQIDLSVTRINRIMAKRGKIPISKKDIIVLKKKIIADISKKYFGKTYKQRIKENIVKHQRKISKLVKVSLARGVKKDKIISEVKKQLTNKKYGRGNSLFKSIDKILISESNRVGHISNKEYSKQAKIPLMKWHTSGHYASTKAKYGWGEEICQIYETSIQNDVGKMVHDGKIKVKGSLEGVYLTENIPDYPHPNCECWTEPVI